MLGVRRSWTVRVASLRLLKGGRPLGPTVPMVPSCGGCCQACRASTPGLPLRVDCLAVQVGSQRGFAWVVAPTRVLAKAWTLLIDILDGCVNMVAWMPAHLSSAAPGSRFLSDGDLVTAGDVAGNVYAHALAKSAAKEQRVEYADRRRIRALYLRVAAAVNLIGQATDLADHFPRPDGDPAPGKFRDSEAVPRHKRRGAASAEAAGSTRTTPWTAHP